MRNFLTLMVCCGLVGIGHAGAASAPTPAASAPLSISPSRCAGDALHSVDYARSITAVRQLPELDAWSRSHAFPVAFGESVDKQILLDGRCYWSVSVFANRPERLELWNIFYVQSKGKSVLVQDPVSGEAISLEQWRTNSMRS